jgi:membrane protease YdiL (CAAX protease family)
VIHYEYQMTIDQVFNYVFATLFLISFGLWIQVIQRLRTGQPVVPQQQRSVPGLGLLDVAIIFACWLWGQVLFHSLAGGGRELEFGRLDEAPADQRAIIIGWIAAGQLLGALAGLAIIGFRHRPLSLLRFSAESVWQGLRLGGWAFLLVVPPILLLQLGLSKIIPYQHATLDVLNSHSPWQSFVLTWFGAVVVAPICEEFFFRGILQDWLIRFFHGRNISGESLLLGSRSSSLDRSRSAGTLSSEASSIELRERAGSVVAGDFDSNVNGNQPGRGLGDNRGKGQQVGRAMQVGGDPWLSGLAIGVGALMFGLVHLGQGLAPIPLFFFGLALGYLYYRTGNIISCLVLHGLLNGFSMFWKTLGVLLSA